MTPNSTAIWSIAPAHVLGFALPVHAEPTKTVQEAIDAIRGELAEAEVPEFGNDNVRSTLSYSLTVVSSSRLSARRWVSHWSTNSASFVSLVTVGPVDITHPPILRPGRPLVPVPAL